MASHRLPEQTSPIVRVEGLSRTFGGPKILDHVHLQIDDGSIVALMGRSGSGKSTLLRTLAGLDQAPPNVVFVPKERAVMFQEPRLVPWKSVFGNVVLGLRSP